jgi:16S rRNA (guanine527-N7)-methyltransferase
MKDDIQTLVGWTEKYDIWLSASQKNQFRIYGAELIRWQRTLNLVSEKDRDRLIIRHMADSLLPLTHRLLEGMPVVGDMGSGAGFPGVPIAICRPELTITLIDSNLRKASFLKQIVRLLRLERVTVYPGRLEQMASLIETFDVVLVRAVDALGRLATLVSPVLKPEGRLIAYKGPEPDSEIQAAIPAMEKAGLALDGIYPGVDRDLIVPTTLIVVKKTAGSASEL